MSKLTFKGGVHPFEGKDFSKDQPIQDVKPGKLLVYPLNQHIGAPASPVVAVGDEVKRGQVIAKAGGFVSANIHCSVSGKVKAIEPRMTLSGLKANSIVIENDGEYTELSFKNLQKPLKKTMKSVIRERISNAGIVGMGGAGFPTHVKVAPKNPDAIDYVIVNGAECEPYLTSDYRRMLEEPERLVAGLQVLLRLFTNAQGVFAIEDNKPQAIAVMTEAVKNEKRMSVKTIRTKYPQGAERTLIYAITGREINSSMLPADAGCVVQNVDTVTAIGRAVFEGRPLMDRIVTFTGDAVNQPANFRVPIGMMTEDLIDAAGGFREDPEKIISGGTMMGKALSRLDVPIVKTSSSILALTKDEVAANEPSNCIKCGRCMEVCPGRIVPQKAAVAAAHGDVEAFLKVDGMECCECGCCSFICPAKRHLTQTIGTMRKEILASRKKK